MRYVPLYLLVLGLVLFSLTIASKGTAAPPTEPCLPSGGAGLYDPAQAQ